MEACLSQASYTRLRAAIATRSEAFFAARAALLRARITKSPIVRGTDARTTFALACMPLACGCS